MSTWFVVVAALPFVVLVSALVMFLVKYARLITSIEEAGRRKAAAPTNLNDPSPHLQGEMLATLVTCSQLAGTGFGLSNNLLAGLQDEIRVSSSKALLLERDSSETRATLRQLEKMVDTLQEGSRVSSDKTARLEHDSSETRATLRQLEKVVESLQRESRENS